MRVPQRLDYTLRALTRLSQVPAGDARVIGELAVDLSLPKRFLEQQMTTLAKHGLVTCRRGAGGGCALARAADDITVADVVLALQGEVIDVPHVSGSAVSAMWAEMAAGMLRSMRSVTLQDLAERQDALDLPQAPMYHI
jgi:Rrf2 family protein